MMKKKSNSQTAKHRHRASATQKPPSPKSKILCLTEFLKIVMEVEIYLSILKRNGNADFDRPQLSFGS